MGINFLPKKISTKLILSFLAFTLLIGVISYIALSSIRQVAEPINNEIPLAVETLTKTTRLDSYAEFIRYYDEVLTQSARNYAFTSDVKWKNRYNEAAPKLDDVIKSAMEEGDQFDAAFFSKVDKANIELVKLETKSLELVDKGMTNEAVKILESQEYWDWKTIYQNALIEYVERRGRAYDETLTASTQSLNNIVNNTEQQINDSLRIFTILFISVLAFALIFGYFISRSISKPVQELYTATKELEKGNFKARVNIKTKGEMGELGEAFNRTIEALGRIDDEREQIDKAKTDFISITSHELRSPMTPMKAQLQMILGEYYGKLNEQQKESLEIILRNTERLDNIIVDFLEISRIEAARLKFNFTKTDITPNIKSLVEEMKNFIPEKKIAIELNIGKLPIIETDPDRLMQVLRNLINNAKKFSPEKSTISIKVEQKDQNILFTVQDQGVGIKPEAKNRIFEPFFQEEQTIYREYSGTGLGLAICKGIVESQNGKIWFESEAGKGTTFQFTIPLKPQKELKPIRLLFSEQEAMNKKMASLFVEILGPIGLKELDEFGKKKQFTKENIVEYINSLNKNGVLNHETYKKFMKKALSIIHEEYGYNDTASRPGGVSAELLKNEGLVK
jgi:signal transduction histidine kinase